MEEYKIEISDTAERDLSDILDYISIRLQELIVAMNLLHRIQKEILSLHRMHERYRLVTDDYLAVRGFRMLRVENYLVFYTVDQEHCVVNIVRVLYGKREWNVLL